MDFYSGFYVKQKNGLNRIFLCLVSVICVAVVLICVLVSCGKKDGNFVYGRNVYFLALGSFAKLADAESFTDKKIRSSASGYVYPYENVFKVLGFVYLGLEDAENIKNSLSQEDIVSEILTIKLASVTKKIKDKKVLKSAMLIYNIFVDLYENVCLFDNENVSESEAFQLLIKKKYQVVEEIKKLNLVNSSESVALSDSLQRIKERIEVAVRSSVSGSVLSSETKTVCIYCVIEYQLFAKNL